MTLNDFQTMQVFNKFGRTLGTLGLVEELTLGCVMPFDATASYQGKWLEWVYSVNGHKYYK